MLKRVDSLLSPGPVFRRAFPCIEPSTPPRIEEGCALSLTTIHCGIAGCSEPVHYKIAARWSDGVFNELKTYGFACADHLGPIFRAAEARRSDYTPSPGESLGIIQIYRWEPGKRDALLVRLTGLEDNYRS